LKNLPALGNLADAKTNHHLWGLAIEKITLEKYLSVPAGN
jgi:hypothetical protein